MAERRFEVDPDIRRAKGPPAALYHDPRWFETQREVVFPRTWHFAANAEGLESPGRVRPFVLLEGCLDEPLLLVRDSKGELIGLSNVCTHRGNLIVEGEWSLDSLRCRYHGRRFHLDGTFAYMPAFEECEHFPGDDDYLPRVPIAAWRGLVFASLRPAVLPDRMVGPLERRLASLGVTGWRHDPSTRHEAVVEANWALVMENLLDGFHVPYFHVWRRDEGDVNRVRTELSEQGSVRIEECGARQSAFELPQDHPDRRRRVAAYHFHLFPTTMLSVYPWGMWLSYVMPLAVDRTRLVGQAYLTDPEQGTRVLAPLYRERAEDEALIAVQQRGIRSRLYRGGRYSPSSEQAVHHFHRTLASWMAGGTGG